MNNRSMDQHTADLLLELAERAGSGLRGHALFHAGLLVFWTGDDARASALHAQALAIGRRIADPTITAQALSGVAHVALRTDVTEAGRLGREALAASAGTAWPARRTVAV